MFYVSGDSALQAWWQTIPGIISDYGKIFVGTDAYREVSPRTLEEARAAVSDALNAPGGVRVRGSGHSLSGMSVPRLDETLIRTTDLDYYEITAPDRICVGAGVVLWDLRDFLADQGWLLPVYNGGWAGPTVGGYVNAGGMGLRVPPSERAKLLSNEATPDTHLISVSEVHGGFWEHVSRITLIDGQGKLVEISEHDADFRWLFAACGQLGLIVETELKILPADAKARALPIGQTGRVPRVHDRNPAETDGLANPDGMPWLYWFSYLVDPVQENAAWAFLGTWAETNKDVLTPSGGWVGPKFADEPIGFRYVVRHRRFTPPLLYPHDRDFVLMGVMAAAQGIGQGEQEKRLLEAEAAFVSEALANDWSLYCQAENLSRGLNYEAYLGPERFKAFQAIKARYDPDHRFNPGEVFEDETRPPLRAETMRKVARAFQRALAT